MKHYFFILLSLFVFLSCETSESSQSSRSNDQQNDFSRIIPPENVSNEYDAVGQAFLSLLNIYYIDSIQPSSHVLIEEKVNLLAKSHPYFIGFDSLDYHFIPFQRIETVALNPNIELDNLLNDIDLPELQKNDFREFVALVINQWSDREDENILFNQIIDYETFLINDQALSAAQKKHLLQMTSIVRHAVHAKKKRPKKNTDMDWDWLTACIVGTLEGGQQNEHQALLMSLKAGILENN